jgi:hypothetical protein
MRSWDADGFHDLVTGGVGAVVADLGRHLLLAVV